MHEEERKEAAFRLGWNSVVKERKAGGEDGDISWAGGQ